MSKKRVLMTGSEGRIGTILRPFLEQRYDMSYLDKNLKLTNNRHWQIDLSDSTYPLGKILQEHIKPEYIIHLAAESRARASFDEVLPNNILATNNLYVHAVLANEVKRIIFASSNHVSGGDHGYRYATKGKLLAPDFICPDGPYGVSKAFGEALAKMHAEGSGLSSICLRIGSVHPTDDPWINDGKYARIWLSHDDLKSLVEKSIEATASLSFGIYYGISNNEGRWLDISNAEKDLGYAPLDDASKRVRK